MFSISNLLVVAALAAPARAQPEPSPMMPGGVCVAIDAVSYTHLTLPTSDLV